jgi:diguanylate cyclase (GGDEF)-like protein
MGGKTSVRPSLTRPSLFALVWHLSVWGGWALVAVAAAKVQPLMGLMPAAFWVIAALVLLGELRPVRTAGSYDAEGTVTSTAFVFAILYLWGLWPALLLQAVVTVTSELVKRKPPWKIFFNVGQYVLSVTAAWYAMVLVGLPNGIVEAQHHLTGGDLLWIVPSWVIWFVVNDVLVSGVGADVGQSFVQAMFTDIFFYIVTTAAVLALSPLVVLAAQASGWYVPLLLIPMFAVHKTARISLQEQHKALHDPLTGLPNRKFLLRSLGDAVEQVDAPAFALALLDLDRFKEVNDTLGHHVGDRLLELVATRISGVLRPADLVARLGGDEFAVYLPDLTTGRAAADVAMRIRQALNEPFQLEDVLLELEVSIGIALFPENGRDVDNLMRRADVAMYLAKELHTDVEVYDPARDRHSTGRLGLLASLRRALDAGELDLHYQPKVALEGGGVVGVEALIRWRHPERGFIPPDEFIPLAETSGLMHRLTAYVINTALAQVALWRDEGFLVAVAVNVSARDLHGTELARTVSEALARHRVPATLLKLELTERTLMAEHSRVLDTLIALEALDVELSLDDFGTGYSSMFMLKRLPVSEIKVDQSFVSRLTHDGEDASIVRSIIDLAHGLGLQAVAEGVETEDVWDQLVGLGCDTAQGWFVSRPMPAAAATDWLREHFSETDHASSRADDTAPYSASDERPGAPGATAPALAPEHVAAESRPA